MSDTYSVYEVVGDGRKNYIGSVDAEDKNDAIDKASTKYGAPIIVE